MFHGSAPDEEQAITHRTMDYCSEAAHNESYSVEVIQCDLGVSQVIMLGNSKVWIRNHVCEVSSCLPR